MSGAEYSFVLTAPEGGTVWRREITDLVWRCEVLRQESGIGYASIQLRPDGLEPWRLRRDVRLYIYQQFPHAGKQLLFDQCYLLRRFRRTQDMLECRGKDANGLLDRRVITYLAGDVNASTTTFIDDALKELVSTNLGLWVNHVSRSIIDYLTIAPDHSAAPTTRKAFSYNRLFDTMVRLAQDSAGQGTYLAFDLTAQADETRFLFETYTGQRGRDRRETSTQPLIFSAERGNIENVELLEDYEEEVTRGYAGAQGTNETRLIGEGTDTARALSSPFGLIEEFKDQTQILQNDTTGANNAAAELVRAKRPRVTISADYVETPDCVFNRDFEFGDYPTLKASPYVLDVRLSTVRMTIGRQSAQDPFTDRVAIGFRAEGETQ